MLSIIRGFHVPLSIPSGLVISKNTIHRFQCNASTIKSNLLLYKYPEKLKSWLRELLAVVGLQLYLYQVILKNTIQGSHCNASTGKSNLLLCEYPKKLKIVIKRAPGNGWFAIILNQSHAPHVIAKGSLPFFLLLRKPLLQLQPHEIILFISHQMNDIFFWKSQLLLAWYWGISLLLLKWDSLILVYSSIGQIRYVIIGTSSEFCLIKSNKQLISAVPNTLIILLTNYGTKPHKW